MTILLAWGRALGAVLAVVMDALTVTSGVHWIGTWMAREKRRGRVAAAFVGLIVLATLSGAVLQSIAYSAGGPTAVDRLIGKLPAAARERPGEIIR